MPLRDAAFMNTVRWKLTQLTGADHTDMMELLKEIFPDLISLKFSLLVFYSTYLRVLPLLPQPHIGPFGSITICPSSPAIPYLPL